MHMAIAAISGVAKGSTPENHYLEFAVIAANADGAWGQDAEAGGIVGLQDQRAVDVGFELHITIGIGPGIDSHAVRDTKCSCELANTGQFVIIVRALLAFDEELIVAAIDIGVVHVVFILAAQCDMEAVPIPDSHGRHQLNIGEPESHGDVEKIRRLCDYAKPGRIVAAAGIDSGLSCPVRDAGISLALAGIDRAGGRVPVRCCVDTRLSGMVQCVLVGHDAIGIVETLFEQQLRHNGTCGWMAPPLTHYHSRTSHIPMAKKKQSAAIKILFIGNSFTQRNDLPGLLAAMAAERKVRIQHRLISAGGASLRKHWNAGRAAKAITTGGYDYVVLQEQSTLPVKNAQRMAENVRLFDEAIKQAGAKTVLYMTWARQHAPESQQAITDAYNSIGKEVGAIVVPVGLAWQKFLAKHDRPLLYDRDQSHPRLPVRILPPACSWLRF